MSWSHVTIEGKEELEVWDDAADLVKIGVGSRSKDSFDKAVIE